MGVLKKVTGQETAVTKTSDSKVTGGGHLINAETVLNPTSEAVYNPNQSGSWESVRSKEVIAKPKYFTEEDSKQLKADADNLTQGARHTTKAYNSLIRIEKADAKVHKAHGKYVRNVAKHELDKKRSDAKTARFLHGQRPQYARLGFGIQKAETNATQAIEDLKAKFNAVR